jgi:hypothetical protein
MGLVFKLGKEELCYCGKDYPIINDFVGMPDIAHV